MKISLLIITLDSNSVRFLLSSSSCAQLRICELLVQCKVRVALHFELTNGLILLYFYFLHFPKKQRFQNIEINFLVWRKITLCPKSCFLFCQLSRLQLLSGSFFSSVSWSMKILRSFYFFFLIIPSLALWCLYEKYWWIGAIGEFDFGWWFICQSLMRRFSSFWSKAKAVSRRLLFVVFRVI